MAMENTDFQEWSTTCPFCGVEDQLTVLSLTVERTGERRSVNAKLRPDGFTWSNENDKDGSSSDELVQCGECGGLMTLDDLYKEN